MEVTLPVKLATVIPDLFLLLQPEQGFEPLFNRFAFGFQSGQFQHLVHEFVIDDNVGSHGEINVYEVPESYTLAPVMPIITRSRSIVRRKILLTSVRKPPFHWISIRAWQVQAQLLFQIGKFDGGYELYWPELDEDLSTEGLLRGAHRPDCIKPVLIIEFESEKTTQRKQNNPQEKGNLPLIHPLHAPGHVFQLPGPREHHKPYATPPGVTDRKIADFFWRQLTGIQGIPNEHAGIEHNH